MASYAQAKTLIYTHADSEYDEAAEAGPAARALFEDPSFDNKLLLVTEGGEKRYTFDIRGLKFKTALSHAGELRWDDSDNDLTLGGGFFEACFYTTLWEIILQSKRDLNIHVKMDAVYVSRANFSWDDDPLAHALNRIGLIGRPLRHWPLAFRDDDAEFRIVRVGI